jgi:ribosomal protein S25
MTEKRKQVDLDINAKMDICKQVDSKISRKEIADRYGIDVSTIAKILKNSETIEKDFQMC